MITDFDALEDLTKAATQGLWDYRGHEVFLKGTDSWPVIANCRNENDAAFIAIVNPSMVLKLIAGLRKVKAERNWLAARIHHDGYLSCPGGKVRECRKISCKDCWLEAAHKAVTKEVEK